MPTLKETPNPNGKSPSEAAFLAFAKFGNATGGALRWTLAVVAPILLAAGIWFAVTKDAADDRMFGSVLIILGFLGGILLLSLVVARGAQRRLNRNG